LRGIALKIKAEKKVKYFSPPPAVSRSIAGSCGNNRGKGRGD